jgi:hypothetical protein
LILLQSERGWLHGASMAEEALYLANLHERHPGLTPAIAQYFFEAASVCLERHHDRPAAFTLEQVGSANEVEVDWLPVGPSLKVAYANTIDTTEAGAYGMCLAALERVAGLVAIQRGNTYRCRLLRGASRVER